MTADESLPTYDFEIPLEIKNLEKKAEILQLWETAKNAFATNDVEKIRSNLIQITELDESLYVVWYNLGIAEDFAGWCFNKAIELKPDHIDSWRGKEHYHELGIRDYHGDDNLDQHIHADNHGTCMNIPVEIKMINKFKKLNFCEFDDEQLTSFQVNMETGYAESPDGANILNLSLCCLKYSLYDEAIKLLETHWYNYTTLHLYFLGIAYRLSGNLKKSLEQFDEILNQEPENVYALLQKGLTLYKNGDISDGKKFLEKSIHVEPNSDFFKLCIDDNREYFSESHFIDSLKTMKDEIDEKTIDVLDLDTERLYNYNQNEPRIGLTWNYNYFDFEN